MTQVHKTARQYCFRTYPLLTRIDKEIRKLGVEGALEAFEEAFKMGVFKVEDNKVWFFDEDDKRYVDVTYLREELIEACEEGDEE